ncbi:MAG TPA: tryptophan synthase subunit alpha [Nevskiaceae bacterium]
MTRYAKLFGRLEQAGRGAFIPFTVLGYPDMARCREHLELLAAHADALELGIPFSDPTTDGPTIQRADQAALAAGATPASCLRLLAEFRASHPELPVGLLVYANLAVHRGVPRFYADLAEAGVDSALVVDVPTEEAPPFADAARQAGVAPVFIAPPGAAPEVLARIAAFGAGYTYVLARAGVTGAELAGGTPSDGLLARLAAAGAPPPVLGFGMSTPGHVRDGIRAGAAGVISGSAVVERLRAWDAGTCQREAVAEWLAGMHGAATRSAARDPAR